MQIWKICLQFLTKKIESINSSTININDPTAGNRIIDMDILRSVINLLPCPSCKRVTTEVSEVDSKRKGLASFLLVQCS